MSQDRTPPLREEWPEEASSPRRAAPRRRAEPRASVRRSLLRVLVRASLLALPLWLFLGLEGLVRVWDGNVLPEGRILTLSDGSHSEPGQLVLRPGARARIGLEGGVRFELRVDAEGLRRDPNRARPLPEPAQGAITITSSRVLQPGEESDEAGQVERTLSTVPSRTTGAVGESAEPLLLVGDEVALGWGVNDDATFASRLNTGGVLTYNAAVPAYSLGDALSRADGLLKRTGLRRLLVTLNEADDYDQVYQPALARVRSMQGWMRPIEGPEAQRPVPPLLGDRLHLLYYAGLLSWKVSSTGALTPAPGWLVDPAARLSAIEAMGEALEQFADQHPGLRLGVLFVPSPLRAGEAVAKGVPYYDELTERGLKPWDQPEPGQLFREALRPDLAFLDLTSVLATAQAWQASAWLSEEGHAAAARAIQLWLSQRLELSEEDSAGPKPDLPVPATQTPPARSLPYEQPHD